MSQSQEHLLIPLQVDALVVDQKCRDDAHWSPDGGDMFEVVDALKPPGPKLFSKAGGSTKDDGVYLRWVLPSGHRHAHGDDFSDENFLAIPDRWLVVRFFRKAPEAGPELSAWVIDSAYNDPDAESNNLITEDRNSTRVGKRFELKDYQPTTAKLKLTAIGNHHTGAATFATQVANSRNVLSFHDDFRDLHLGDAPSLSYLVVGWLSETHANPQQAIREILQKTQKIPEPTAEEIFEALHLATDGVTQDDLKRRPLFHGMIAGINYWDEKRYAGPVLGYPGSSLRWPARRRQRSASKIGVGSNSAEAVAALVAGKTSEGTRPLWQAIEAACHGKLAELLSDWSDPPHEQELQQRRFQPQTSALKWRVVPKELSEDKMKRPNGTGASPSVPLSIADEVLILNKHQQELDRIACQCAALQEQLYATWWRGAKLHLNDRDDSDSMSVVRSNAKTLIERPETGVAILKKRHGSKLDDRDKCRKALHLKLEQSGEWELHHEHIAPHWHPSEPVVAVQGLGWGHDDGFENPVPWRRETDVATSAKLKADEKEETITTAADIHSIDLGPLEGELPGTVMRVLLNEAALIESAVVRLIEFSRPGSESDQKAFDDWFKQLRKPFTAGSEGGALLLLSSQSGPVQASIRLARVWHTQPWSPRFIEWEIEHCATGDGPSDFDGNWEFSGAEYRATANLEPAAGEPIQGRTLLAPASPKWFDHSVKSLQSLLDSNPADGSIEKKLLDVFRNDIEGFREELAKLKAAGVLVQPLGGFHDVFLSRDATLPGPSPKNEDATAWLPPPEEPHSDPTLGSVPGDTTIGPLLERLRPFPSTEDPEIGISLQLPRLAPPGLANISFTPVRACTIKFKKLRIVDDFGQWVDLLHSSSAMPSKGVFAHPSLRIPHPDFGDHVALPPRIIHPSRLHFSLLSASDRNEELSDHPKDNPICGWVVYNHVDRGLIFYDAGGGLLGELELVEEGSGRYSVNWECLANPVPPDQSLQKVVKDSTLQGFATALCTQTPATTLPILELFGLIDQALPVIRPGNPRAGDNNALLAGRPLALMNATLMFRLFGQHAWSDPFGKIKVPSPAKSTGNTTLDNLKDLPVRIGCARHSEDGLVGYFHFDGENPSFGGIMPFDGFKPPSASPQGFVGGPNARPLKVGFVDPAKITLLIDPRGIVQASAGVVPAESVRVPHQHIEAALRRMEVSLRVEPVLTRGKIAMPTPAGRPGEWRFRDAAGEFHSVAGVDPKPHPDGSQSVAEGGHLVLRQSRKKETLANQDPNHTHHG